LDVEEQVAAAFTPLRSSGNWFALLASLTTLARLHVLQGRLRQAGATYAEALTVAPGDAELRATVGGASYYLGIGDLHREWNDLPVAEHALRTGLDLTQGSVTVDADVLAFGYISYARLHQAQGNIAEALATLDAFLDSARQRMIAEHLIARGIAERARVALMNGDLESSVAWSESSGLALDDEITFVHEDVYLLLARVYIAMGTSDPRGQKLRDALELLERMLNRAEADKRANSVVPIHILRALALHAQGNRAQAHAALGQALIVAAPGGYICVFVDEGAVMADLLRDVQQTGVAQSYIGKLLGAFDARKEATKQQRGSTITSSMQATTQHPQTSPLIEPLTDRELEVLQLLVRGLSNQSIADELVVAVGTVKRHLNSIFTKLEVQSRLEASARARELGLV
jgi:LuxR family maltose regulon positive regulatory protein